MVSQPLLLKLVRIKHYASKYCYIQCHPAEKKVKVHHESWSVITMAKINSELHLSNFQITCHKISKFVFEQLVVIHVFTY